MNNQDEDLQQNITEGQQDNAQDDNNDSIDWKAEALRLRDENLAREQELKERAIARRWEKKLLPRTINQPKQEHDDEVVKKVNHLSMLEEKRQFGYENGLSPQETDYAFKFANGKPTKEILQDSFFKGGIESLRAQNRLESNIPSSSSRSAVFADKPFEELSEDDRRKAFEARMKRK